MTQRLPDRCARRPPRILVAIEEETAQALVCVALEHGGFHPIAVTGPVEAAAVWAELPAEPVGVVVMGSPTAPISPLDRVSAAFRQRSLEPCPTVLLHRPRAIPGEPPLRLPPPDLGGLLAAVGALAVRPPATGDG